jgi:hypothetical protein
VFGGQMKGNLVSATYAGNQNVRRVILNSSGTGVLSEVNLGAFSNPLDVTTDAAGVIYVAEHGGDQVTVLIPNDSAATCPSSFSTDDDADGFTDADEAAHGTDPCSAASVPPDFDGDFIGDLTDSDLDGDTVANAEDQLNFDPNNGANTVLPLAFEWNPGDGPLGGVANTGFTGVQIPAQGVRLDASAIHVGAAGGFMAITTSPGTAQGAANSQVNGLQLGFDSTAPFRMHVRIVEPFNSVTPAPGHVGGIYFGPNQDNFVRAAIIGQTGGAQALQVGFEQFGAFNPLMAVNLGTTPVTLLDLYLIGDPATHTIKVYYDLENTGVPQLIADIGGLPSGWFSNNQGTGGPMSLAGIMTSHGTAVQTAFVFDFFRIDRATTFGPAAPTNLTAVAGRGSVQLAWTGSAGAVQYYIYRGTSPAFVPSTATRLFSSVPVTGTTYTDTAVINQTTYYYVVTAVDSQGRESLPSNQVLARPGGPKPR